MTNAQQRIAIAEWLGWTPDKVNVGPANEKVKGWWHHGYFKIESQLPDYCTDLNAMHEATRTLSLKELKRFSDILKNIIEDELGVSSAVDARYLTLNATAAQRAKALLKLIKVWKED